MKNISIILFLALLILFGSCNQKKTSKIERNVTEAAQGENLVKRGEYLVTLMDCVACHTPKKMGQRGPIPDMDRFMMGFDSSGSLPPLPENISIGPWALFSGELTATVGPWGTTYAANITPHASGIGNWTLEQFSKAMREGKYKGLDNSRPIMPPMPIEAYKNLTDKDLEAIFAYLKTLKPIENVVPGYQPPTQ